MGYPVTPPSEQSGILTITKILNLTTVRQSVQLPSGALWAELSYNLLPGSTATAGQYAKIVINASSDADANGKLSDDNSHVSLMQGQRQSFFATKEDPIYRIDVISKVAFGAESTILQILAGVKS